MSGTCALPMKYATRWRWENVWLLHNGLSLVLLPVIIIVSAGSPSAWGTYRHVSPAYLAIVVLIGVGWGVGASLCGLAYNMLGIGLGMSIVLGLAAISGSILPLVVRFPSHLFTSQAGFLYWSLCLMVLGLALTCRAGALRQRGKQAVEGPSSAEIENFGKADVRKGIPVAIVAGVLSGLFNVGLVFADEIRLRSLDLGVGRLAAVNLAWLPVTVAGFLVILSHCSVLLSLGRSWHRYTSDASHWLLVALMGGLYAGSISLYGQGTAWAGELGPVLGFPAYMSTMILTGNIAGIATGEWRGSSTLAYLHLTAGLAGLLSAAAIASHAASMLK